MVVGFLGKLPEGTPDSCGAAPVSEDEPAEDAFLDFSRCNHIANVAFLRFSSDASTEPRVTIDAVEALSIVDPEDP